MKGTLLPLALAAVISPSAYADTVSEYFPTAPEITSPAQGETDVHPDDIEFETSAKAEVSSQGNASSDNLTFESVYWSLTSDTLSEAQGRSKAGVILGGLYVPGNPTSLLQLPRETYQYSVPENLSLEYDSVAVKTLHFVNRGYIELLSESSTIIGTIWLQADNIHNLIDGNNSPIINVMEYSDSLLITQTMTSATQGNMTFSVLLKNDGSISISASEPVASGLFTLSDGRVGVELNEEELTYALSDWKTEMQNAASSILDVKFSRAPDTSLQYSTGSAATADDTSSASAPWAGYESSASYLTNVSLLPGETYTLYAQHVVRDSAEQVIYSSLSESVEFSTLLDTNYELIPNFSLTQPVAVQVPLSFTMRNTGTTSGRARVEAQAPLAYWSNIQIPEGFDLSTLMEQAGFLINAETSGSAEDAECSVDLDGDNVILFCEATVPADSEATFTASIVFKEIQAYTLYYRVCETKQNGCDDAEYEALTVNVTEDGIEPEAESSSSGGGGSALWLTLLALPLLTLRTLLRRRR